MGAGTEVSGTPPSDDMLMRPEDFQGPWNWKIIDSGQGMETPAPENNNSIGHASIALTGEYHKDGEIYLFLIFQYIRKYESSVPSLSNSLLHNTFSPEGIGETISFDTIEVGRSMESRCTKRINEYGNTFFCEIFIQHTSAESFLRIMGNLDLGKPAIEEVINDILLTTDNRIELGR